MEISAALWDISLGWTSPVYLSCYCVGDAAAGQRPPLDAVVNGPTSYPFADHPTPDAGSNLSSPASRQPMAEQSRNRRPLVGQGAATAPDVAGPATVNFGAFPPNIATQLSAPVGRPIVKGYSYKHIHKRGYGVAQKFAQMALCPCQVLKDSLAETSVVFVVKKAELICSS